VARPDRSAARRQRLVADLARTFAELGYRRATTRELARRCKVQEVVLYRLWPDKRAMFVAALEFVAQHAQAIWQRVVRRRRSRQTTAERLLDYEAEHLGEFGLYRILFAGWSETDDPAIRAALQAVYTSFVEFLRERIAEHRQQRGGGGGASHEATAWAMVGLGTVVSLGRELQLLDDKARRQLLASIGRALLG
jgi:AcrR family transcriptional regulator